MAVQYLTVIRHSLTQAQMPGQTDDDRHLSLAGLALADRRGKTFAYAKFDFAIVSGKFRTHQTARVVGGWDISLVVIPWLFQQKSEEDEALMSLLYARVGQKTLAEYHRAMNTKELSIFTQFASRGWDEVRKVLVAHPEAQNILMVNHAVYAPAIIHEGLGGRCDLSVYHRWWSECSGVVAKVEDGRIVEVTPLPDVVAE